MDRWDEVVIKRTNDALPGGRSAGYVSRTVIYGHICILRMLPGSTRKIYNTGAVY